ncbi:pilus assembly protein TadE [Blastococcus sp. TF02-09]|uniref:TadE/TadG family type IV pilus assembly protein n=1 Tax=Blastococcus sp. TF02-09 TaxID=2250576 RepID=UPI000DE93BA8|nr:pilus assembly protein TadE [Blastococcus sp. TF02-9]RBY78596.1 pilus assembly protein TadE [Blastococcus sp. TF02-9]
MNRRLQLVTAPTGPPRRDDRGSESVELAILLPVGILILAMLVIGARIALAGDRVSGVAGIAARDASLARSASAAQQVATASAADALADRNLHCADVQVSVDTTGFNSAPGVPASVTVTVACTVGLSDIGVAGLPGSRTLRDTATSPLDPARELS